MVLLDRNLNVLGLGVWNLIWDSGLARTNDFGHVAATAT